MTKKGTETEEKNKKYVQLQKKTGAETKTGTEIDTEINTITV